MLKKQLQTGNSKSYISEVISQPSPPGLLESQFFDLVKILQNRSEQDRRYSDPKACNG